MITKKTTQLTLCKGDYEKIMTLMSVNATDAMEILEEEISGAQITEGDTPPADTVGINTLVEVRDLDKNSVTSMTIVLPKDANLEDNKVSILAPMGMAVIGLKSGQKYEWPMPNGKIKNFEIVSVKYVG